MALKLVSSQNESKDVVIGEAAVIFTNGGVYFSCSDYVKRNPAYAAAYLQKLTDEVSKLIK